ncbi:hypothetical protein N9Y31_03550 [Alphaproteobacteria bacterium]|nr:hypothetical protein [Alphaproteobacteria bacterium]
MASMAFEKKKQKKPKLLRKVTPEDGNALVKTTAARYTKNLKNGANGSHEKGKSKNGR